MKVVESIDDPFLVNQLYVAQLILDIGTVNGQHHYMSYKQMELP